MKRYILLIFVALISAGCDEGDPAITVRDYLQAKVQSDEEGIQALLCSEMEDSLPLESSSFQGVAEPRIEGMLCERVADNNVVSCEGKIIALYGEEEMEFELGSYRVVQEDGEWKWCGEAALP